MKQSRNHIRGMVFALAFAAATFILRQPLSEVAPPPLLDAFILGIGIASYFFNWLAAAVLLVVSLALAIVALPAPPFPLTPESVPDVLRLILYAGVAASAIYGIDRLKRSVLFWRDMEETFRIVFEDASDAITVTDAKLNILDVNARTCELLGYSREELVRLNVRDILRPEDLRQAPLRFDEALLHKKVIVQERTFRRKDGSSLIAETSVRALRDGRLIAIARDISERRRYEETLRDREALTRSVIYTAVDGIITIDEKGLVLSFNPAAERLFGYSADEVIGRNVSMLMPSPWREEHDSYIKRYVDSRNRKVIGVGREVVALRKDGVTFPVELSVSEMLVPGRRMFTGIVHDISQRKRAEEAIREANETLRAVIDTSPLAICVTDLQGVVKSWNAGAERIFGWTASETIGKALPVVPVEEWGRFLEALDAARRGETFAGAERRRKTKAGETIDIAIWNAPLRDREGAITGILSVFADVTGRRKLEDQLRQSQKMEAIGRLAGGVAHDFNNILTVIAGYGQMLAERLSSDPVTLGDVEEILKASEHASALTSQLLVFSRHRVTHPEVIRLSEIVSRVERMLRRVIGEDVELVTRCDAGSGSVRADPSQIEQVVLNLAVNARDAMPDGGRLTIETTNVVLDETYARTHIGVSAGRYVLLAVSDTGVGMEPDTRSRLFEPFFTTKEKGKGTGLGLSTVYGIVTQCSGHIWVYSEPGKGSTFKVYLPRVADAAAPEPAAGIASEAVAGSETVLLVEDEPGVRKLVRNILAEQGYDVLEAADPQRALETCGQHRGKIHLLLTDVVMPHMSGRDLAERAVALRPELRVLYMSGYTDTVIVHHGIDAPGTPFIQKPFAPSALVRKVRQVLDGGA